MKRPIVILLLISVNWLFSCGYFASGPKMPAFSVLLIDSSSILNMKDVPEGKPTVVIFFSPDCEHCQALTESILKNMKAFQQVNLYFITIDPLDRLKVFNHYYKLSKYPNVTLGRDFAFYLPNHFNGSAPPFLIVFDRHRNERATFSGETKAEKIITFLNQM